MERIVYHNNSKIQFVSNANASIDSKEFGSIALDSSFDSISDSDLLENYVIWRGTILPKSSSINCEDIKVAFVSNYKSECGIATYSENLYKSIIPYVSDYRIFAESEDTDIVEDKVVRCWRRGQPTTELISKINEFKPDVILLQHEYGLWPDAKIWLSLMTQLNNTYKVFVVLHSVYENHSDKTVCELAIKNIIVHTNIAVDVLTKKGLPANIIRIPHGCDDLITQAKPWNMYRSNHTFVQFGFGFRYKGWENSLKVVANLKEKFPDVFFTGVFSESPLNKDLHQNYFNQLIQLTKDYGIEDNVGFIRGFIKHDLLLKVLAMNRTAIFPYIENGVHTVMGCSGAARSTMSVGIPVIVSQVPLFDDLEGVCPRCSNTDEITDQLISFWDHPDYYKQQVLVQNEFLKNNAWNEIAKQFLDQFSKLN